MKKLPMLLAAYLLALKPKLSRKERFAPYKKQYFAHRGLFNREDRPENSMAAYRAAVEAGYGIEMDVQLTSDGKAVLLHDKNLKRMTGVDRDLYTCTYEELRSMPLGNSKETIPLFEDVLKLVNGRVPLIIEIKPHGSVLATCREAARLLKDYPGEYCIESFHPLAVFWYRLNHPEVLRGQLASDFFREDTKVSLPVAVISSNLLTNLIIDPDFVAYNHEYADQFSFKVCRALYHPVCIGYTFKSFSDLRRAAETFDVKIFDSFIPDEKGKMI
ncbi:MAG: hypothetical protein IKF46_04695 [Erysipelotrichaceae bacterium]|nr:hypothetical protein [Erysipelotrichaceae bacterium]